MQYFTRVIEKYLILTPFSVGVYTFKLLNKHNQFSFFKMYLLGKMKNLTPNEIQALMKIFQNKPYLDKGEKHELANLLNRSEKRIDNWFIERRAQARQAGLLAKGEEY